MLSKHSGWKSADELSKETSNDLGGVASTLEKLAEEKFVDLKKQDETTIESTEEGKNYAENGTPEKKLFRVVSTSNAKETALDEALKKAGLKAAEEQIALQWAIRNKWLLVEKHGEKTFLKKNPAAGVKPDVQETLKKIFSKNYSEKEIAKEILAELRMRKLFTEKTHKIFYAKITESGKKALQQSHDEISQLSPQMLKSGEWKKAGAKFEEYPLETVIAPFQVARKHPYKQFLQRIKEKLVGLGFREVRGSLAEIEFWNLDALYMPQDHPARQIHDVFFVRHPGDKLAGASHAIPRQKSDHYAGEIAPPEVFQEVFAAHKHGGKTGSRGWQYEMSREISSRVILRSHDTGISAREMFKKLQPPDRVFFIAHVFRPDEIDWKHFIEFNQLGGYVADENTSFRDLLGTLKTFAEEVFEAEKIKFVPSYFPFTEPSVELYAKIPGRGWAEIGGAGLCRPEMLAALGIDYPVIAWGLGVDRLAMLSIGINDIRELHSHNIPFLQGK